ncbi:DUF3786 domain-containing protein [Desulfatibacillum aliphaticivorans]|uniref:DUF3786 domain-containing protein n=1 Tax=Desulfatibacillum aliphaticivorans TaxID=218208 RepID=UPI0004220D4C|nr:DUF3786 domain-containing protein [Desulfatibacillum aliphaticivorans]
MTEKSKNSGPAGETASFGGFQRIYQDLLEEMKTVNVRAAAQNLGLPYTEEEGVEVPFLGRTFLISNRGAASKDGEMVREIMASVLFHYIMCGSAARPAGRFVTLSELAGPLFKQSSYSGSALERPIARRFAGKSDELLSVAESLGGRREGEAGLGGISLVFETLPHILMQIVFYDQDKEFPAKATLLFDANATKLMDFESLAVLATIFIRDLVNR